MKTQMQTMELTRSKIDYKQQNIDDLELFKRYKSGDEFARDELILKNESVVKCIAKKHYAWKNGLDWDDLVQIGFLGLIEAVDKYNPEFKVPFNFYAKQWIKAKLTNEIYNKGRTIRTPIVTARHISKVDEAKKLFESDNGREPTLIELSEKTGLRVKVLKRILKSKVQTSSIYMTGDDGEYSVLDSFSTDTSNPRTKAIDNESILEIKDKLDIVLSADEAYVVKNYFGIGCNRKTYESIGKDLQKTKQGIRAINLRSLKKLKEILVV
jgi:RNA polymerase primary sigma factor